MNTLVDPELDLLGEETSPEDSPGSLHAFKTAPIFTGDAFAALGPSVLPQRALYGRVIAQQAVNFPVRPTSSKLYINTNAPFSALVCGVQGSGKSHSTSVLLESCLMADPRLGTLPAPLSAIVFHFDTAAGGGAVQPCEAAYLASLDTEHGGGATPPGVTVLVLPANLKTMKRVYAPLPSVHVEPLHFSTEDISGERLLAMMKVDESSQMPLYMEAIMTILRSMESNFSYTAFRDALKEQKLNGTQKAMLNLRLSLLDSCLAGGNTANRVSTHFRQGQLTIIDLSSPFMDGSSACGFFDMILGLFVEADVNTAGKLIVLDEAHKYLSESQSGTSARLTDSLLSVIRQQRHLATRVVISTQEPTVVPTKFLDLCSFIIAHRFSSPKWLRLLANHVSAAEDTFDELFSKIVALRTGQAIMFAPNGVGLRASARAEQSDSDSGVGTSDDAGAVAPLAQGYLHVQSRLRVTRDGGHSILAVSDPEGTTRVGRVPGKAQPAPAAAAADPNVGWGAASSWSADPSAHWGSADAGAVPTEPEWGVPDATASAEPEWGVPEPTVPAGRRSASLPPADRKGKALAEAYAAWGGVETCESVQAGGASAPAEDPADASAPPGLHSVEADVAWQSDAKLQDQMARSAAPTAAHLAASLLGSSSQAAHVSPAPGVESTSVHESSTAPPFFDLTGELVWFKPLMQYVLARLTKPGFKLTIENIRKGFTEKQPDVYGTEVEQVVAQAVQRGLLLQPPSTTGKPSIMLIQGATYKLTTNDSTFDPSPDANWGYTSARHEARSGGASAPAEGPAEASVPSELRSAYTDHPSPDALDTAIPATVERSGALPVFDFTGDLARFKPLMKCLLPLFPWPSSKRKITNVCNHLIRDQPHAYGTEVKQIVEEAVQLGLLHQPPCDKGKPTIMLVRGATYKLTSETSVVVPSSSPFDANPAPADAGTSAFVLRGKNARFAPLVQYLDQHRNWGVAGITEAALKRRFGQAADSILSSAKQYGMIHDVGNSTKPKVMLVPGVTFDY
ncbi:hypothetical protein PsYK624_042460 [Phanerochaete sordida]|uniref:Uncharacterized protein n=1 Tax=Phanerochaete sordida TaxID=48140 RepID=A0A9P3G4K0_9APHY|nr:hypothetical protein PsYK624_042460 [Phanerochaete sordida]